MPDGDIEPERIRAALEELLGWQGIARSPQLAQLLRYIVEKTLAGDSAGIKAYSIAVDVFGRPPDFDPQSDPIVRVQARRLRALLYEFYENGNGHAGVHIQLPLGRYVPEFRAAVAPATLEAAAPVPGQIPAGRRRRLVSSRFILNALLGLAFTVIGVSASVAIVRWVVPQRVVEAPSVPETPRIAIGAFDNLTGNPLLDDDVKAVGARLGEALGRFSEIEVREGGLVVSATVQMTGGQFVVRAILSQPLTNNSSWSATIKAPPGLTDTQALTASSELLAAQLGNASGPLHAPGRAWLKLQTSLPDDPTPYLCLLQYMEWRDSRRLADADTGAACFDSVLKDHPDDAIALAAVAGMRAWRTQFLSMPGDNLSALMVEDTSDAGRAVALRPDSSFVYEEQAVVLARQGSVDAALGAIKKSHELNPASMDAVSVYGTMLWLSGQYAEGMRYGEEALNTIPSPPAWYYLTRGFNALREQRFFDAIDAAQALAAGDEEFGPVIALAAAPRAGRPDLVDRYRPMVMTNPQFQSAGILPRLAVRIRSPGTLQRFREGLLLAGIPPNALDRPFNSDGSERTETR